MSIALVFMDGPSVAALFGIAMLMGAILGWSVREWAARREADRRARFRAWEKRRRAGMVSGARTVILPPVGNLTEE